MKHRNWDIKNITKTAMLSAIVYVMTAYLKVPTPIGYAHLGDGAVCLAATLLPFPLGIISAVLGAGLADVVGGYFSWLPITVIVKGAMSLAFKENTSKILCARNLFALALACILNVSLYFFGGAILYGSLSAAVPEILPNLCQSGAGAILFIIVGGFLDTHPSLINVLKK